MPSSGTLSYVWWRGVRMDANSIPSLLEAEKRSKVRMVPVQGGYNKGEVAASAGTHDGGATIDLSVRKLSGPQIHNLLLWMRRCGWAAWLRSPAQGFSYHVHAVRIGDVSASRGAKAQVVAYRNGRDGLARNRPDNGPDADYVTWERSKYNPRNAPKPAPDYVINGKRYKPLKTVSVYWINQCRLQSIKKRKVAVSRHVHRLQVWLASKDAGAHYKGKQDGIWGVQTQRALDDFRRKTLGWADYKGSLGFHSLQELQKRAATTNKYKIKNGK